jgi:hypothetical protein
MSIKFFGQFLIERAEVDAGHVREALDVLESSNRTIGEIAIAEGMMTLAEAEQVTIAQRAVDKSFGDLAVALDLLNRQDLVACLMIQRGSHVRLGEALVQLGYLASGGLDQLLDEFKVDQEQFQLGETLQLPDPLANNRVAPYILALLQKLALRIAGMQLKIGFPQPLCEAPPYRHQVSVQVNGPRSLEITLMGDDDFCTQLAVGTSGIPEAEINDELITDAVGEFLNVVCGNTVNALERDGVAADLGMPDYQAELSDGWIFDLACSRGRACVVLSQF